jgi:hypothetical protein
MRAYRNLLIGLLATALAAASGTSRAAVLDSSAFTYRYEMDVLPTTQDLDSNGTPDFGDWRLNGGTYSVASEILTVQASGGAYAIVDSGSAGNIWQSHFSFANGFTAEFKTKIVSQDGGTQGAFQFYTVDGRSGTGHGANLYISATGVSTSDNTVLDSNSNSDGFHVFRVAQRPNQDSFDVWRDGIQIGTALASPAGTAGRTGMDLYFGNGSSALGGVSQTDYLRLTPGEFAPISQTLVAESVTRYRAWQAFRPFTQTAYQSHELSSTPTAIDVPYFLGSGLNTIEDDVRESSSAYLHPNTYALPTLMTAMQAYQPDLNGFIADFNLGRAAHSNLVGVSLGDEVYDVFGQGGVNHGRAVRDWIVQNPNPAISSLMTISSNSGGDEVADNTYAQNVWNNTLQTCKPDVWLAQVYPFAGPGLKSSYYRSMQWYHDWAQTSGVAMWVYPQAYGISDPTTVPSESELRLQRFTSLAYGVQGFSDFLWSARHGGPQFLGSYLTYPGAPPTPLYQELTPINREIAHLTQALERMTLTRAYHNDAELGVFHFSDSDAGLPPEQRRSGHLLSVTSGDANQLMTSFFRDLADEEYFMVVNKRSSQSLTGAQLSSTVTLTFDSSVTSIRRLRRSDGLLETLPLGPGHTFTYSLTGGTGDLFKIDDGVPFMGIERLHYENFEGPYSRLTPEALCVLDPTWTTGGLTAGHGAVGSMIVRDGVGTGGSRGAQDGGVGLYGNQRHIPTSPLFTSTALVTLEGDLSFNTSLKDLGSGQLAGLLLASDAAGNLPLIDLQAGNGDFVLKAATLGGLPTAISLSHGAGVTGNEFHLALEVNLGAKLLCVTVSGDASLTTGWLSYTGDFLPTEMGLLAGRFGDLSDATWDNISITAVPEPPAAALVLSIALGLLVCTRLRGNVR